MNRLPILLAGFLSFGIWTVPLEAVLTFTFSPNGDTGSTILTLSGGFHTTSSGFTGGVISGGDGLWDFFENDGKALHLHEYIYGHLKITIWGFEPSGKINPLTITDSSAVSPTGSDGVTLRFPFGFEKGAYLGGSGSYPMDNLPFSKFNPGSGEANTPVNAPFAIVVEDANGPVSAVPAPAGLITVIAVAFTAFTVWRRFRD